MEDIVGYIYVVIDLITPIGEFFMEASKWATENFELTKLVKAIVGEDNPMLAVWLIGIIATSGIINLALAYAGTLSIAKGFVSIVGDVLAVPMTLIETIPFVATIKTFLGGLFKITGFIVLITAMNNLAEKSGVDMQDVMKHASQKPYEAPDQK